MKYGFWILQAILAVAFLAAGGMKLFMPIETLEAQMGFVSDTPNILVRFIGFVEIAGALGLILPAALRVKPWLTPLAAVGLGIVMILAIGLHASRAEWMEMGAPAVLLALLALVAYGRWNIEPVTDRETSQKDEKEEARYTGESAHAH